MQPPKVTTLSCMDINSTESQGTVISMQPPKVNTLAHMGIDSTKLQVG